MCDLYMCHVYIAPILNSDSQNSSETLQWSSYHRILSLFMHPIIWPVTLSLFTVHWLLLMHTTPPRSKVYPLLAIAKQGSLLHWPDSSLCRRRERDLGSSTDYRGLNKVTVKYHYPLPLVSSALKQLNNGSVTMETQKHPEDPVARCLEWLHWSKKSKHPLSFTQTSKTSGNDD